MYHWKHPPRQTSNLVAYHSFPNSFQSVYFVESTAIFEVVGCMSIPILNPFKTWFAFEKIMVDFDFLNCQQGGQRETTLIKFL